jgi:hypothetical protein
MQRSIHALELLIPGKKRLETVTSGSLATTVYRWPCGCIATGDDPEALNVASCSAHADVLAS